MKQVTITPPEGYEIDKENSTFEKIVFKEVLKVPVQKKWEDFGEIEGYYIDNMSNIILHKAYSSEDNRNIIPTLKEAEAMLALIQLMQWRDKVNGQPLLEWCDWSNSRQNKYIIHKDRDTLYCGISSTMSFIMAFKTREIRDQFFIDHKDLLETAKILL